MTGEQTPSLRKTLARAFSPPLAPSFGRTGRQIKTGRQQPYFARSSFGCFLPVNLVFIAAFAALKVSFPGACPGKDGFFILTKRQHSPVRKAHAHVFSSCYSFVLKVRFRGAKTNYYKIIRLTLHRMGYFFTRTRCEYHLSKTNITAILLTCKREYHCAARRPKEEPEEKTFEQA